MTDELNRAKRAFAAQEPIRPRRAAREAAITAAMAQFDQQHADATQGNSDQERLMKDGGRRPASFKWRRVMMTITPNRYGFLAGGVSIAAVSAIAFNAGLFQDLLNPGPYEPTAGAEQPAVVRTQEAEPSFEQPADAIEEVARLVEAQADPVTSEIQQVASADAVTAPPVAPEASPLPAPLQAAKKQEAVGADAVLGVSSQPLVVRQGLEADNRLAMVDGGALVQPSFQEQGRDKFADIDSNPQNLVSDTPVSTFSIDVDTASYAFVRSELNRGVLPPKDAVRVEEMINYFDYSYPVPTDRSVPFQADLAIMPTPWNDETKLLRIGIKGYDLSKSETPKANLVFLVDTSGSMDAPNKLPLLRNALRMLVTSLDPDDRVSIVAYAGSAGTVLEPTSVSEKAKILSALDRLHSGGSTAGAEGIRQAYQLAEANYDEDGVNRVILATDGDFNVGITNTDELKSFIERKRDTGIGLSVLGFGQGNYNDELMQALAQNGNGNAAYIDTLNEARKTLVSEAGSTLFTIAKDVKIQLEFNPATIREYRLIGYETRLLDREDFNNDKVDAGDIGAGHSVTALYELTPVGSSGGLVDDLRYGTAKPAPVSNASGEYGFLKIRYKQPDGDTSELLEVPITQDVEVKRVSQASDDTRFAAAVAAFGQVLRDGRYTGDFTFEDVVELAQSGKGDDPFGYRSEFISLAELAKSGQAMPALRE